LPRSRQRSARFFWILALFAIPRFARPGDYGEQNRPLFASALAGNRSGRGARVERQRCVFRARMCRSLAEDGANGTSSYPATAWRKSSYKGGQPGRRFALRDAKWCAGQCGTFGPKNRCAAAGQLRPRRRERTHENRTYAATTPPRHSANRETRRSMGMARCSMPWCKAKESDRCFRLFSEKANVFDAAPPHITALKRMGRDGPHARGGRGGTVCWARGATLDHSREGLPGYGRRDECGPTVACGAGASEFHLRAPLPLPASHRVLESDHPLKAGFRGFLDVSHGKGPLDSRERDPRTPCSRFARMKHQGPRGAICRDRKTKIPSLGLSRSRPLGYPARSAVGQSAEVRGSASPVSEGRTPLHGLRKEAKLAGWRRLPGARIPCQRCISRLPRSTLPNPILRSAEIPLFLGEQAQRGSWLSSQQYMVGATSGGAGNCCLCLRAAPIFT